MKFEFNDLFRKFELNDRLVGRIIGISMAAAVAVTVSMASEIFNMKGGTVVTENISVADNTKEEYDGDDTAVIPFIEGKDKDNSAKDAGVLYDIYSELVTSEKQRLADESTTASPVTTSTTTTAKTAKTTSTSKSSESTKTETTAPTSVDVVSNGKKEFNYNDVSSIASGFRTLEDFVNELNPTSFCWDTSDYQNRGYVKISLISAYGNVTLDVKPTEKLIKKNGMYMIDNEEAGSLSGTSITDWEWYNQNKSGGCNICSVTWISEMFAIAPVRGVEIGTNIADLTDAYLCVNGGATTLYKASDVITDQNKLNALLDAENAYTFVGGRVYTIDSYLEKYYSGKENSYRFASSSMVVQYGCNSIMDCNYTSGSWIIEYAIRDDVVVGITFMNKSYYDASSDDEPVEDDTVSTTSSTTTFDQFFGE